MREHGVNCVVIERGRSLYERARYDPNDIANGVGGAGLFSDGKFSFYPSATRLWRLEPQEELRAAYEWVGRILRAGSVEAPSFPTNFSDPAPLGTFGSKDYKSIYMPLQSRFAMIRELENRLGDTLHSGTSLTRVSATQSQIMASLLNANERTELFRAAIFATGRLGPLLLHQAFGDSNTAFRRFEVGVRIRQPAQEFFLRDEPMLDPKRIWRSRDELREWRTFCCCKNGEIVPVRADGIVSVSGRSDVPPTGLSSVGLHLRIYEPNMAAAVWAPFLDRVKCLELPIREPLDIFLKQPARSQLNVLFGSELAEHLREGLERVIETYSIERTNAELHGPTVEGTLYYPSVDDTLRLARLPVWVAGDASGLFRGITAALVSGYFAAIRTIKDLEIAK